MSSELDLAMQVVHAVHAAGGRALFVGGWVRDRLLSRKSRDIDIEVYGLNSEAIRSLLTSFGRVVTVGESFTVYKLGPIDISMPRRESKSGHGHGGFTVVGDPTLSIADAARRRDFTINAIAWDPLSAEYLDLRRRPRRPKVRRPSRGRPRSVCRRQSSCFARNSNRGALRARH